jgi:hypothetical protein
MAAAPHRHGDDGTTYVVHEATGDDTEPGVQLSYNRIEVYDADGRLIDTVLRKHRLRWWAQDRLAAALVDAGFAEVSNVGDERGWVALARTL